MKKPRGPKQPVRMPSSWPRDPRTSAMYPFRNVPLPSASLRDSVGPEDEEPEEASAKPRQKTSLGEVKRRYR